MILLNKRLLFGLAIMLFSLACNTNNDSSIPDYTVYLVRNINSEALALRTIGGYETYTSITKTTDRIGYGGLLVIYGFDENYYAFDLTCPHEIDSTIRVVPNGAGQAVCGTCGSIFSVGYGSGNCISGPSKEALRKYQAVSYETVSGPMIRVTN